MKIGMKIPTAPPSPFTPQCIQGRARLMWDRVFWSWELLSPILVSTAAGS